MFHSDVLTIFDRYWLLWQYMKDKRSPRGAKRVLSTQRLLVVASVNRSWRTPSQHPVRIPHVFVLFNVLELWTLCDRETSGIHQIECRVPKQCDTIESEEGVRFC
jgi:hypothetical protein